ncbi:hypothetical protein OG555_13610 [Kribbella sp. NBC_01484]|uniref:hypothetical protein n=1 Tax=Kribbella sp. NBC_01484 TaxID=2903579 RepID=UPI002E33AD80|nr:hypothetical protein [Kribbella sp. NBC_01484]
MSDDEPIYIDVGELAGVDADTYAAADSGDRQAQKLMLRNLLTADASAAALTTGHWTAWMLRMIATGERQAIADMLGSIAEAARAQQLPTEQKAALDELVEQYFGPGAVGAATVNRVRAAFAGEARESAVVDLYLLSDRLASGEPVGLDEVADAVETSEALEAPAAEAFFTAVSAQLSYSADPVAAFRLAVDALEKYVELREQDEVYAGKVGMTALLGSQLADIAGEPQASMMLRAAYFDEIQAFQSADD